MDSGKLIAVLEEYPNLANRALVKLLEDERNIQFIKTWISEQSMHDLRFAHLAEKAGITVCTRTKLSPRGCDVV